MPILGDAASIVSGGVPGLSTVESLISSLLSIKGKTKHFTYEVIYPQAASWSTIAQKSFANFTDDEKISIAQHSGPLFLAQMQAVWGLSANMSSAIANSVGEAEASNSLGGLLLLFYLWIGTNIDSAQPSTLKSYMTQLYPLIFIQAVTDAGLDKNRIQAQVTTPATKSTSSAGYGSMLAIAAVLGAGLLMLKKKAA